MLLALLAAIADNPAVARSLMPSLSDAAITRALHSAFSASLSSLPADPLAADPDAITLLSRIWPLAPDRPTVVRALRSYLQAAAEARAADPEICAASICAYSAIRSFLAHSLLTSPSRTPYLDPTPLTTKYIVAIYDRYTSTIAPDGSWPDATPLQAIHRVAALDTLSSLPGRRIHYPAIHRAAAHYLLPDLPTPDKKNPKLKNPNPEFQVPNSDIPNSKFKIQHSLASSDIQNSKYNIQNSLSAARLHHTLDLEPPYLLNDLTLLDPHNHFPSLLKKTLRYLLTPNTTPSPPPQIPPSLSTLYLLHTHLLPAQSLPA